MSAATQVYYASFDAVFLKLPAALRGRVQARIDEIGLRLASYSHHQLKGSNRFRARVGDYRIIYTFDFNRIEFICWLSGTGGRSIAVCNAIDHKPLMIDEIGTVVVGVSPAMVL